MLEARGNPGYSGKQCFDVFEKLSVVHMSWIPFDGIMLNLFSGLQGWVVTCVVAAGAGSSMVVFILWLCSVCFVILVIVMLVSSGNSLDNG